VSIRNVTLAGLRYDLIEKPGLWLGLDAWLVYNAIEPIKFDSTATPPSPLQLVVEPQVGMRFGKLRPSVGFIFPIGGRLADAGIAGVNLHIDFAP
jgi:hypothetical protein